MTKDEFLAALRQFLMIVAGGLVTAGYLKESLIPVLVSILVGAASFAWMLFSKKAEKKAVAAEIHTALMMQPPIHDPGTAKAVEAVKAEVLVTQ